MRFWHYGEEFSVDAKSIIEKSTVNDLLDEICLIYNTHNDGEEDEEETLMIIYDDEGKLSAMLINKMGEHEDLEIIFKSATEKNELISYFDSLKNP